MQMGFYGLKGLKVQNSSEGGRKRVIEIIEKHLLSREFSNIIISTLTSSNYPKKLLMKLFVLMKLKKFKEFFLTISTFLLINFRTKKNLLHAFLLISNALMMMNKME